MNHTCSSQYWTQFTASLWHGSRPRRNLAAVVMLSMLLGGCASLSNPVASGVQANRIPTEFLKEPREDAKTIPLTMLRQPPPNVYRLAPGDTLGIWVEGVLGDLTESPPVNISHQEGVPPSIGYPIPVREDGTISLPLVPPLVVADLTVAEAEEVVRQAYTVDQEVLQPGKDRIIVTLMRPRQYHVLVIRQDSGCVSVADTGTLGSSKRGTGFVVDLAAYENDVLNALARTGGLPGLKADNEVIIYRTAAMAGEGNDSKHSPLHHPARLANGLGVSPPSGQGRYPGWSGLDAFSPSGYPMLADGNTETIRIPLRLQPGEPPPFRQEDVILRSGDIVFIEARDRELYYTGGLLPIGEHVLPRDYDLDVVEAIARVGGPIVNGGFNANNEFAPSVVLAGIGAPSPSQVSILRKTPGGGQLTIRVDLNRALRDPRERILIQPGDILVLQESPTEAMVRYFTQVFNLSSVFRILNRRDAQSTATLDVP